MQHAPPISFALAMLALAASPGCGSGQRTPEPAAAAAGQPTAPAAASQSALPVVDWQRHFGERRACFVVLDETRDSWLVSDETRCNERFRPFSTFKIPNALIGIEVGAVSGADTVIEWDEASYPAEEWWPAEWRQPLDLRAAMKHSAVPYFRTLAKRIGAQAMQAHLKRFAYGNQLIDGGLDLFWLDGELAISAVEQVRFLRKLHRGELPVSRRAVAVVEDILVHERGPGYVVRAKTGTGVVAEGHALGWFVGYVERGEDVHYFALNLSARAFDELPRHERMAMTRAILVDLGVLPPEPGEAR